MSQNNQIIYKNKKTISEFANQDFIKFSRYDCERSLPSMIDGQKITARKVLYTLLNGRENIDKIKVAALGSYTAVETDYHHGEQGVSTVICNMAQDFIGSNNMNLLEPMGQFGSRTNPDAAAARYIFTKLSTNFRKLFNKADDLIIDYQYSDDLRIEPNYYVPMLPVVLINGSQGIGTGFATNILSYNPEDIRQYVLANLEDKKDTVKLKPWYRGFTGTVEEGEEAGQWIFKGVLKVQGSVTIKVTELPIGMYAADFKKTLIKLQEKGIIKEFDSDSVGDKIDFTILAPRTTTQMDLDELYDLFKLRSRFTENMVAWTDMNKLVKFDSAETLADYFIDFRLSKYEDRRVAMIDKLETDLTWMEMRIKFIEYYLKNSEKISKMKRKDLEAELLKNDFEDITKLLEIKIYNLTSEQIQKLKDNIKETKNEIKFLKNTNAKEMYKLDLNNISF